VTGPVTSAWRLDRQKGIFGEKEVISILRSANLLTPPDYFEPFISPSTQLCPLSSTLSRVCSLLFVSKDHDLLHMF